MNPTPGTSETRRLYHQQLLVAMNKEAQDKANKIFERLNEIADLEARTILKAKEFAILKATGQYNQLAELSTEIDRMAAELGRALL